MISIASQELNSHAQEQLKLIFEGAPDYAICTLDVDGRVIGWNTGSARTHGFDHHEMIGADLSRFYISQDIEDGKPKQDIHDAGARGRVETEAWRVRRDGSCFWAHVILTAVYDADRKVVGFCQVLRDASERKQLESLDDDRRKVLELIAQNAPLGDVLSLLILMIERQSPEAITSLLLFREGRVQQAVAPQLPPALQEEICNDIQFPVSAADWTGEAATISATDDAAPWLATLHRSCEKHGLQTSLLTPVWSGDQRLLGLLITQYLDQRTPEKRETELLHTAAKLAAVAIEHRELSERLAYQAQHDPLTGLPNRLLFEDRLRQAIGQHARSNNLTALFYMDLDRFKIINDTLGHEAGDNLLRQVSHRLSEALRKSDTLARLGGDEFTVILPDLKHREDAVRVARKLLDTFASPFILCGRELFVSSSIGVAVHPHDGGDIVELQKNADVAMYRAKHSGRNCVECFTREMNAAAVERLEMEGELRHAIEESQFVLHYQPQVDREGSITKVEALVRWNHPRLGLVAPARFIPIAEDTGLIVPLGAWVLQEACAQAARWRAQGISGLKVAVNVSAAQFIKHDFVDTVMATLNASGLPAQAIELELTESVLMKDAAGAAAKVSHLSNLGIEMAIDDFGTGYSSLAYLQRLPVRTLKIDRSFIGELRPGADLSVVKAISSLAHSLRLKVVAEGIETEYQRQTLLEVGCDGMQGYLFGKPSPALEQDFTDYRLGIPLPIPA